MAYIFKSSSTFLEGVKVAIPSFPFSVEIIDSLSAVDDPECHLMSDVSMFFSTLLTKTNQACKPSVVGALRFLWRLGREGVSVS